MRTPDPYGFIDALTATLPPPMPTYSFTDHHIMRFTAILIAALGAVQGGRDTSLAAEAAFLQLPPRLPRAMGPTSTLAAPPVPYLPPAPYAAPSHPSLLDDRGPRDRHREQHSDADQRGPRSRSHLDHSPAHHRHSGQSPSGRRPANFCARAAVAAVSL